MTSRGKMKKNKPNAKKSIGARSGLDILTRLIARGLLGEQTQEAKPEDSGVVDEKHKDVIEKVSFERFGENMEGETIHNS